jgi:aspartyl protease family protein
LGGLAIALLLGLAVAGMAAAADPPVIRVLALFPGKAMLSIDGNRHLLAAGETSPEGIRLLSATAREAEAEVAGERVLLHPGGAVSSTFATPPPKELRVVRNSRGSYAVSGRINGRAVAFLVDTGASSVAMGEDEARRLGIPFELAGDPIRVATASGIIEGYRVILDSVEVGDIRVSNVEGNIVLGRGPDQVLLGMSFLNRLEFENRGNLMLLRQKY